MKKILIFLLASILVMGMVACSPSAEEQIAQKVAQDVIATSLQFDPLQGSTVKDGGGTLEYTITGYSGTATVSYSSNWTDTDYDGSLGGDYTENFSINIDVTFVYDNFQFTQESEYILDGTLSATMAMTTGTYDEENLFQFMWVMSNQYVADGFSAEEVETGNVHTLDMDVNMDGSYEVVVTTDGENVDVSYNSEVSFTGTMIVNGIEVDVEDLDFENDGFYSGGASF